MLPNMIMFSNRFEYSGIFEQVEMYIRNPNISNRRIYQLWIVSVNIPVEIISAT